MRSRPELGQAFPSNHIVAQLSDARLIDSYQVVVNPVAIGGGKSRSRFQGIQPTIARIQNCHIVEQSVDEIVLRLAGIIPV